MYSDEGIKLACDIVGSPSSLKFSGDVELDDSKWSTFMKECNEIKKTATVMSSYLNVPVMYLGGIDHLKINCPVRAMTYRTDGGIQNADQYWAKEVADWEAKWPQILIDAGLN
jgi:hypothetical protein